MIEGVNYSNSAIKVFDILQKLMERDCSKSELMESFSDDSLLFYINTLKEMGFEITSPKSRHEKYKLLKKWDFLNFNDDDIDLLIKIKNVLAQKTDYLNIINFNNLLLILSKYTTEKMSEKLTKVIAQQPFGIELHERLFYFMKCIENKTSLVITYQSPNSEKNYFEILPQAVKLENAKVYILGYESHIIEKRCLRPEKIISVRETINLNHKEWQKPVAICEFNPLAEEFLKNDEDVELLENNQEKIIAKITAWNNFELMQKIFSYGNLCKVLSPEDFKKQVVKTLGLIRENYSAKAK